MNELTRKQKEVKTAIKQDYGIKVSNRWFNKYLWMYSKLIPKRKLSMSQSLDVILENPCSFAFFIFGYRSVSIKAKTK